MSDQEKQMSAQELMGLAQEHTEDWGKQMDAPGDEWIPTAYAATMDKELLVLPINPEFFSGEITKDILVASLGELIQEKRVYVFAIVLTAHSIRIKTSEIEHPEVRPPHLPNRLEDSPDSEEIVIIHSLDADESLASIATVQRSDTEPPKLSDWRAEGTPTGRFVSTFRDAIKIVRRKNEKGQ